MNTPDLTQPARARAYALLLAADEELAALIATTDLRRIHAAEARTRAFGNLMLTYARAAPLTDMEEPAHAGDQAPDDDQGPARAGAFEAVRIELRKRLADINAELERRRLAPIGDPDGGLAEPRPNRRARRAAASGRAPDPAH